MSDSGTPPRVEEKARQALSDLVGALAANALDGSTQYGRDYIASREAIILAALSPAPTPPKYVECTCADTGPLDLHAADCPYERGMRSRSGSASPAPSAGRRAWDWWEKLPGADAEMRELAMVFSAGATDQYGGLSNDEHFAVERFAAWLADALALPASASPEGSEGPQGSFGYCAVCYHPLDRCSHCDAPEGSEAVAADTTSMRRFTVYRRGDLSATHNDQQAAPPDAPQYEGVVFSDGRVALRWLTPLRSVSVWDSLDDALGVHGHPEPRYGTEFVWHDAATPVSSATKGGEE